MEPKKFGRTLGIGVRVASNILRDRAGQIAQSKAEPSAAPSRSSAPVHPGASGVSAPVRTSAQTSRFDLGRQAAKTVRSAGTIPEKTRAAGRGAKKFGQAFWGPLSHASGILWLEITGLFFALFSLFFLQNAYRIRGAWMHGAEHGHFLLYAALTLTFVWFSTSSFVRARRKSRKKASSQ